MCWTTVSDFMWRHSVLGRGRGQKWGVGGEFWVVCWWHLVISGWVPGLGSGTLPISPLWLCSLGSWKHWPPLSSSSFFPKRSPLPYGHDFIWAGTWVEPRGKQPSVPAGAPLRQLLLCHIPGCRGCPDLLPGLLSGLTRVTGFPLPGEAGGSYVLLVPLHLSVILMATEACLLLPAPGRPEGMKWAWWSKRCRCQCTRLLS